MLCSLAAFAGLPLLYRFIFVVYAQIRLLVSMHAENQRYFATPSTEWIPWVKRHMLWAPLFRNRHNKEFQLSQAGNYGTLPTRFQTFFLVGYIVGNAIFCTYMIHWDAGTATVLGEVRNRSGVLSTVNMVPLFILAGRNNPLIQILGISFDTHNLIHRWLGRIVVIEALVHTLTWMAAKTLVKGGWQVIRASITATPFLRWGFIVRALRSTAKGNVLIILGYVLVHLPNFSLAFCHQTCFLRDFLDSPHYGSRPCYHRRLLSSEIEKPGSGPLVEVYRVSNRSLGD